jgi:hypothetical protein
MEDFTSAALQTQAPTRIGIAEDVPQITHATPQSQNLNVL